MRSKMKHAVSLIVLVVTILVLAILAAAVIISLSNANIMSQASQTVFKSDMANFKEAYEMYVISELADDYNFDRSALNITYASDETLFEDIFGENVSDKYKEGLKVVSGKLVYVTEDETEKEILEDLGIALKSPYIGYYADIDGDGTVDGVIFADLAYSASGIWNPNGDSAYDSYGEFSYTAVAKDELKDYVISDTYTNSKFGTKPVLTVTGDTSDKQDRFYVMALSNFTSTGGTLGFEWYDAAYDSGISDYSTVTSIDFGKGKENTNNMISKWNSEEYGAQNDGRLADVWGVIQDKVYGGGEQTLENVVWFIPSAAELMAFLSEFNVTAGNRGSLGLHYSQGSSSLWSATEVVKAFFGSWRAWPELARVNEDGILKTRVGSEALVLRFRLATTF